MVVCHKDRRVNGNRTIDLLYFLIYLQITNALQNFRIPQENFSLGFTTIGKKEEGELRVWTPFGTGWRLRYSGPIRAAPPLHLWKTCHKPASFYLLEITENSKNLLDKVSTKKSLYYSKKSKRKYDRNTKFRALKTEFSAT